MKIRIFNKLLPASLILFSVMQVDCSSLRNINIYSSSEEVDLGKSLDKEIRKQYEILDDKKLTEFLQVRGEKLAKFSKRPDIEYHFAAVNAEEVNAFAIPGGYCYINLGLIRQSQSEAALMSVVAHEISHVVRRHSMKRLSQVQLAGIATEIAFGGKSTKKNVADLFTATGLLYYSREAEREADHFGLVNMYESGYDPRGMVEMFQKLKANQEGPEPEKWQNLFSTHPISSERIDNAKSLIATLPPKQGLVKNTDKWAEIIRYVREKYPPGEKTENKKEKTKE
ncbi:M48 family metallopeptidase [Gemmatimonadota bacterium]